MEGDHIEDEGDMDEERESSTERGTEVEREREGRWQRFGSLRMNHICDVH